MQIIKNILKAKKSNKKSGVPNMGTPLKRIKTESYFGFFVVALPAPAGLFANSLSGTSQ